MEQIHKKLTMLFAAAVFAITFFTYLYTVSPTVSFWDCGEYGASCYTLEIPHPPGNPMYILIGRVVSMSLIFTQEIIYRLNLFTVFSDALVAMLLYLIIVRVFVGFMGIPNAGWKRVTVYVAGIVGALFGAFSSTVAFCSVEAEVNQPLLIPIALNTWLSLVWAQSKDPKRDRLLLLIAYISYLGIGIHMYSMIVLAPIFLFVMLVDKQKLRDWRIWATSLLLGLVMMDIGLFIWTGCITIAITLVMSLISTKNKLKWNFVFWLATFAVVGFSCHLYVPIRSALNPRIDENHPATWQSFQDYINRKQYGSEPMVERMFWRRGTWEHQFGIEDNMGYGGFHLTQFFHFSKLDTKNDANGIPYLFSANKPGVGALHLLIYLIPTGLMLFGFGFLYRKYRTIAILLISLELLTTLGLVFYMNFADGTKSEKRDYVAWTNAGKPGAEPVVHREVRVRDYFYVAGFMYFGMWIGLAAGGMLFLLFTNRNRFLRTAVAPLFAVLFAVSPALPFSQNVPDQSRRGNFVAFDYAYNLLMSCAQNGILITNGDNDTFPLWALQEAYGIRRDVRIVNLSLFNTDWYAKQAKNFEPKVPITFSDDQIGGLTYEANPFETTTNYPMPNAGITIAIPGRDQQPALRVQDKLLLNFVDANRWKKPIYFAITVSNDNFMGLDPYLQMQGMVFQIMPHVVPDDKKIDVDRTLFLLNKVYRFRSLGDPSASLEETSKRMVGNYTDCFIQVVLSYRSRLDTLKSQVAKFTQSGSTMELTAKKTEYDSLLSLTISLMNRCVALTPEDWRPRSLRQDILLGHNRFAEAEQRAREALQINPENVQYLKMLVQALGASGKHEEMNAVMKKLIANEPDPLYAYASVAKNYENARQYDSAIMVLQEYMSEHMGDRRCEQMIAQLNSLKSQSQSGAPASGALTKK